MLILSYRNPIVTAKLCATADVLSGGRVFLGVGTGWWEAEYRALGIPGHFAERGPRTDEYMRIFRNLWTEERPEFDGEFYRYSNIDCSPKPAQPGGIPLIVGGHTGRALRRTAELGGRLAPHRAPRPGRARPGGAQGEAGRAGPHVRGEGPRSGERADRLPAAPSARVGSATG